MNKVLMGVIAIGSLGAASLAQACGVKGGGMWHEMDSNQDGVVSRKEYVAFHDRRFRQLDTNKDGKISQDELGAFHSKQMDKCKPRHEERFREVDVDGDGKLSKEETEIGMPMVHAHFAEIDTDQDGRISQDEFKAAIEKMHDRMHGGHKPMMEGEHQ